MPFFFPKAVLFQRLKLKSEILSTSQVFDHPGIKDLNIEGGHLFFLANDIQSDFCVCEIILMAETIRRPVKQACHPAQKGKVGAVSASLIIHCWWCLCSEAGLHMQAVAICLLVTN